MSRIKIQNIGAIANVEMELNKVNVIMGEQSSGKSTIAKLISYCQWVEKRRFMDGEYKEDVYSNLLEFHHLDKNYFVDNSFFEYKNDFIKISCKGKDLIETIEADETKELEYKNTQNIYIPAERNFVSVIPNLGKYNETNDNIMNFLYEWSTIKKIKVKEIQPDLNVPVHSTYSVYGAFDKQHSQPILDLGVNYYYQADTDTDMIIMKNGKTEIPLRAASSGLQSVIPLLVIAMNIIIRGNGKTLSITEQEHYDTLLKKYRIQSSEEAYRIKYNRHYYHAANLIIEEPEQNLFPSAQRDLLYFLLEICASSPVIEHRLTVTTHSPYILYALNNCMMGGLVNSQLAGTEKEDFLSNNFLSQKSWLNPKSVSIWEIENGTLRSIQDKDGIVSKNYFDNIMTEQMTEYDQILNYYQDEE